MGKHFAYRVEFLGVTVVGKSHAYYRRGFGQAVTAREIGQVELVVKCLT